ncbi:hypothetical protein Tsubulata_036249 [Turnera subulata]|uniref:RRM domain-containing protein n=1 Tax=Turnera subulata TaxID=218843 RepID=A0A9Q0FZ39_9ROSI|nr:hypothetical protein Tsubulata_036249 [Turnera subulata]
MRAPSQTSQPFLSQPMSPGLPVGNPTFLPHRSITAATPVFPQHTSHPHIHPNPYPNLHTTQHTTPQTNPTSLHFSRWSRKAVQKAIDNNLVISVYVENLPNRWIPTDLHLVMSRFGDVIDVFIPKKLNRHGRRFAFVRFKNTADMQYLLQKINGLQVDGAFLGANPARGRASAVQSGISFRGASAPTKSRMAPVSTTLKAAPQHHSYAEAVHGAKSKHNEQKAPISSEPVYIPKALSLEWLEKSALGVLKNPIPISSLSTLIVTNLMKQVSIIPIGGVSFLIKF